jgi:hypothetical protein
LRYTASSVWHTLLFSYKFDIAKPTLAADLQIEKMMAPTNHTNNITLLLQHYIISHIGGYWGHCNIMYHSFVAMYFPTDDKLWSSGRILAVRRHVSNSCNGGDTVVASLINKAYLK